MLTILFLSGYLSGMMVLAQVDKKRDDSLRHTIQVGQRKIRIEIDSLLQLFQQSQQETLKVKRLNLLADLYNNFSFDSVTLYANEARQLAEKINYPEGLSYAVRTLGSVFELSKKDWISAIQFYKQAIAIAEKNNLYSQLHEYYSTILNSYFYLGDFPNAMTIATRGLESAERKKDHDKIILYNNLIGAIYFRQENYTEALNYYRQSLLLADKLNNDKERAFVFLGLSDVYIAQKDSVQAFSYLFRSLDIARRLFDSTGKYNRDKIPYILYRIGYAYKVWGNLTPGLKFTLDALDYTDRVSCNKFDIANYYLQVGDIYRQLKDFSKARDNLYKGLAIAMEIKHKEDTRDAYIFLAKTYADEKKFDSAWFYSQLHIRLKDSVVNEVSRYRTEEIKAIYDIQKKDREIARQGNFRNILIASFTFLLITLGFLYNRYRLRQKNKYQRELNRQQNELFNVIAGAQDQERKRIAQDIHDSLGAILSAAKLRLSALRDSQSAFTADQNEKYETSLQLLDEASSELRNISHNIMPATLSKLGLVAALKNLSNTISSNSGMQISFSAHDFTERIEEHMEISIYRIILELINNVVKHAEADKVTVQLVRYPDYINILVEDNGKGFDYSRALQEKKGIGLGNILSRVDYLKGTMNVDAQLGRGTTVIIDVPLWKTVA